MKANPSTALLLPLLIVGFLGCETRSRAPLAGVSRSSPTDSEPPVANGQASVESTRAALTKLPAHEQSPPSQVPETGAAKAVNPIVAAPKGPPDSLQAKSPSATEDAKEPDFPEEKALPDEPPSAAAKRVSPYVYFDVLPDKRRRVLVTTTVCLREGSYGLECLLCRKGTKEHESILTTRADARSIHASLRVTGAEPGSPVQFDPQFKPPSGAAIKVTLQYKEASGKVVTVPAQSWVRDVKTKKALDANWVFAGSHLIPDPDDPKKPPEYLASLDGAMICVTNVPSAMLDLPIVSPKTPENREFAPFTERIPPLEAKVIVILEPLTEAKKK
jgi:hypothetical protein